MAAIAIAVLAFLCAFPAYFGTNGVVAYVAVTSIATIGLYIAYAIPIYLRLRRATRGSLASGTSAATTSGSASIAVHLGRIHRDPLHASRLVRQGFRGTERLQLALGELRDRSRSGGTLLLVGGWWVLSANKWFKGPIAQGTEEELARIEQQYEHGGVMARRPSSA